MPAGSSFARPLALASAEMHERKEQQREQVARPSGRRYVRTIEEFTASIGQLDDPQEIARTGLAVARQLLGFELAVYYRRRGDRLELASYSGSVPPELEPSLKNTFQSISVADAKGLSSKAVRLGRTVWESDYPNCPDAISSLRDLGPKSVVFASVMTAEGVEGTFGFMQLRTWYPIIPSARWVIEALP